MSDAIFHDPRGGKNTQHALKAMLRQAVYSRLAGYEDTNNAERLAVDPAMRHIVGGRAKDRQAASTSQMSRFETEILTVRKNLEALTALSGMWIDRVHACCDFDQLILDLDSSVSETYVRQEGSAYNGHFICTCYHPLFCFNQFGDLERVLLRNGNVASADDWRSVLEPVVRPLWRSGHPKLLPWRRGVCHPGVVQYLEETEGYLYAIRLPSNAVLEQEIEPFLTRPVGRPLNKPDHGITTSCTRRAVGTRRVAWWPRSSGIKGELFPAWASSSRT